MESIFILAEFLKKKTKSINIHFATYLSKQILMLNFYIKCLAGHSQIVKLVGERLVINSNFIVTFYLWCIIGNKVFDICATDCKFFAFVKNPPFCKNDFLYFGNDFPTCELYITEEGKWWFNDLPSCFDSLITINAETILDFKLYFHTIDSWSVIEPGEFFRLFQVCFNAIIGKFIENSKF